MNYHSSYEFLGDGDIQVEITCTTIEIFDGSDEMILTKDEGIQLAKAILAHYGESHYN